MRKRQEISCERRDEKTRGKNYVGGRKGRKEKEK